MFFFGEDGVVGLQAVLREHGGVAGMPRLASRNGNCGDVGAYPCPWISGRVWSAVVLEWRVWR